MARHLDSTRGVPRGAAAAAVLLLGTLAAAPALAQNVTLAGRMGAKALLVIDGQTQVLGVGETARGVKLLALDGDEARVQRDGAVSVLRSGTPAAVGAAPRAAASREIVLTAGPGGHFITDGTINGQTVTFMVDTGATMVAMGQSDAARLGIDLRNARYGLSETANGTVPVARVTLTSVRVGGIEIANVAAVVMPTSMPHVLLGNSFLTRFQMRRENDTMRLEPR